MRLWRSTLDECSRLLMSGPNLSEELKIDTMLESGPSHHDDKPLDGSGTTPLVVEPRPNEESTMACTDSAFFLAYCTPDRRQGCQRSGTISQTLDTRLVDH